jgi:hypothetical protein
MPTPTTCQRPGAQGPPARAVFACWGWPRRGICSAALKGHVNPRQRVNGGKRPFMAAKGLFSDRALALGALRFSDDFSANADGGTLICQLLSAGSNDMPSRAVAPWRAGAPGTRSFRVLGQARDLLRCRNGELIPLLLKRFLPCLHYKFIATVFGDLAARGSAKPGSASPWSGV